MPLLDVSDLIDDPDFADDTGTLFLVRTARTIGENGRPIDDSTTVPLEGVVMPASDTMLRLLPEGARAEGAIVVYVQVRLYTQATGHAPDGIQWKGQAYTVTALADWTTFGDGYSAAVCTLKDFSETPLD